MPTLQRLVSATEEISSVLLELELDPTRELLDRSSLAGATAERWSAARAVLQDAWAAQAELEAVIERARSLRGKRRRAELEALVCGPSIAGSTPDAVLARMRAACSEARACLTEVAGAWEALVPRLKRANAAIGAPGAERRELARLTASISADPLGAPLGDLDALEASIAFRADASRHLAAARALLDELYAIAEESRAAHVAVLEKTAGVEVPAPLTLPADIGRRLDDVDSPIALTEWSAQAAELLSDGRRILAANRAPIQERTELRGLLDAYHAKARALRALEDPELSKRFERAHRALHTAPTDLREAARLVHDYRRGLGAPGVRR